MIKHTKQACASTQGKCPQVSEPRWQTCPARGLRSRQEFDSDADVNNVFSESFEVTIGGGYLQQIVRLNDGTSLKLDIWDTGGQERYRALLQLYYRDAHAALITYDVTNTRSLENCEYWVNELRRTEENCILCLVANKIDVPVEEKKIEQRVAQEFAEKFGMLFVETSAKSGENINKLFETVAQEIVNKKNMQART